MLILDTNALYYAAGISSPPQYVELNKLMAVIKSSDSVSISYVTLAEFLTKYRKHAGVVRRVASFMIQHHIRVLECELMPIDENILRKLRTIRQKDVPEEFEPIFTAKIDIESRFACAVFCVLLVSTIIFECDLDPYDVSAPVYSFLSNVFKVFRTTLVPVFNSLYRDAYKTDDAENKVRCYFYRLFDFFISLLVPLCRQVIDGVGAVDISEVVDVQGIIQDFSSDEWSNAMTTYQKRIRRQSTPIVFMKKSGLKYGKSINDKHLESLLNGLGTSIQKVVKFPTLYEYLFSIIKKSISDGRAFLKNDINDALILNSLTENDVIVTFDNGMITHMENCTDKRIEYKNSIALIKSISMVT